MSQNAVAKPRPVTTAPRSSSGYTLVANEGGPQPLSAQSNEHPGVDPQEIAVMAYLRWESGGCQPNTADDDWFWAEREFLKQLPVSRKESKGTR